MSIDKPFHRNYRPIITGSNSGYSEWAYILDKEYAKSPVHYVRAFLLIQEDLKKLFEYIEPADINLETYSYRIHALLMQTCIEIEANFKAILRENSYNPVNKKGMPIEEKRWNISNYEIVNKTHHLDSYSVEIPIWNGDNFRPQPFEEWKNQKSLSWYQAYNQSKHDRQDNFKKANLKNLITAVSGLLVLLSSQFKCEDFFPEDSCLSSGYSYYSGTAAIGGYFRIEFPNDWIDDEKYNFNWEKLKNNKDRFKKIDYDKLSI